MSQELPQQTIDLVEFVKNFIPEVYNAIYNIGLNDGYEFAHSLDNSAGYEQHCACCGSPSHIVDDCVIAIQLEADIIEEEAFEAEKLKEIV